MRLLLDTCSFLWLFTGDSQLSGEASAAIRNASNPVFLSPVSAWEIAVKHATGRLILAEPPLRLVPRMREIHGIEPLLLNESSALEANRLPLLHRDPFDRMLICQAIVHVLTIVTPDPQIQQYSVRTLW